tara:strand:+ start:397 stop:639 length:243 start_codon:yes stop_codon:yes gene_type:complete
MREIFQNVAIGLLAISNILCLYKINEQNESIDNLNAIVEFNAEQINKNFAYVFATDEILQMKTGLSPIILAEKKIQDTRE